MLLVPSILHSSWGASAGHVLSTLDDNPRVIHSLREPFAAFLRTVVFRDDPGSELRKAASVYTYKTVGWQSTVVAGLVPDQYADTAADFNQCLLVCPLKSTPPSAAAGVAWTYGRPHTGTCLVSKRSRLGGSDTISDAAHGAAGQSQNLWVHMQQHTYQGWYVWSIETANCIPRCVGRRRHYLAVFCWMTKLHSMTRSGDWSRQSEPSAGPVGILSGAAATA